MKNLFYLCICMCIYIACSSDNSVIDEGNANNPDASVINFFLTDCPTDLVEVNVEIVGMEIKSEDSTIVQDITTQAGIYNLLDFQNGVTTLLGSTTLDIDYITEIRLLLGENNSVLTMDGETFPLETPSAQQSGLKIKTEIEVDSNVVDIIIDFDACKSVKRTGNGKYILKPVLKVLGHENDEEEDDDDDDDEDDELDFDDLNQNIQDYLNTHYPNALFDEAENTSFCLYDFQIIEVELETEDDEDVKIYFTQDGELLFSNVKMKNDLPQDVIDIIMADYPDSEIENKYGELTFANGDIAYLVEIEIDSSDDEIDLLVSDGSTLVCE